MNNLFVNRLYIESKEGNKFVRNLISTLQMAMKRNNKLAILGAVVITVGGLILMPLVTAKGTPAFPKGAEVSTKTNEYLKIVKK